MATPIQKTSTFGGIDVKNPIKEASRAISDAISGFGNQLINPMKNVTETTSGVALVDEKTSAVNASLTNYKSDTLTGIMDGARDLIGGILNNPDLGSILTYQDGFKVDSDQLMRIASQGLGLPINSIATIKQDLGGEFLNELSNMTGGLTSGLYFEDGGKLKIGDGWQMDIANDILGFVSRADGDFGKVVNMAGINAILNTLVYQAAQNSMYQTYGSFESQYLWRSDYVDALINSLEYILGRGDIESIDEIFRIIEKEGIQVVRAQYPDFIERILTTFYFSSDVYEDQYEELGRKLDKLLTDFGGEKWYKINTEFGEAYNFIVVSNVSEDAKTLLEAFPKYHPILLTSGMFQEAPALNEFLRQFPKAVDFEN